MAASAAIAQSLSGRVRRVTESSLESSKGYDDPFHAVEMDVVVTGLNGSQARVPVSWAGGRVWKWRYSASETGVYRYRTDAQDESNVGLHGVESQIEIDAYEGGEQRPTRATPVKLRYGPRDGLRLSGNSEDVGSPLMVDRRSGQAET